MKLVFWSLLLLTSLALFSQSEAPQPASGGKTSLIRLWVDAVGKQTIEHNQNSYYNVSSSVFGLGFDVGKIANSDFQFVMGGGIQFIDVSDKGQYIGHNSLFKVDIQLGARYYPRRPTFTLGKTQARLNASVRAGAAGTFTPDIFKDSTYSLTSTLLVGIHFAWKQTLSGPGIEFAYHPFRETIRSFYTVRQCQLPYWHLRFYWLFSSQKN